MPNKMFSLLTFILVTTECISNAARILVVVPSASISHQIVFRPITKELSKRHEVVVITTDPAYPKGNTPVNLTEVDIHDIAYEEWNKKFLNSERGTKSSIYKQLSTYSDATLSTINTHLSNDIDNIFKTEQHFDVVITEAIVRSAMIYSFIAKAPLIQISSLGVFKDNFRTMGASVHPILYPIEMHQRIHNLNLWEIISELYLDYSLDNLQVNYVVEEEKMFAKYIKENAPTVHELNDNVEMMFLNIDPIFRGIRPVPLSVFYMNGLHLVQDTVLQNDLQTYLDSSKQGVIYMSFGTNTNTSLITEDKTNIFTNVFSKLPYDVLLKWDSGHIADKPENVRVEKWFPQSTLLKHPKIKLFITQGGLQSTDEAIKAGVPLIGIPLSGDQWFNTEKYEYHGIGVKLDMETIDEEQLMGAIKTVISNSSYRQNLIKLRNLMEDKPLPPLEHVIRWLEYLLRYGGKHLRAPAANMSWQKYYEVELVLQISCLVFLMFVSVNILLRRLL